MFTACHCLCCLYIHLDVLLLRRMLSIYTQKCVVAIATHVVYTYTHSCDCLSLSMLCMYTRTPRCVIAIAAHVVAHVVYDFSTCTCCAKIFPQSFHSWTTWWVFIHEFCNFTKILVKVQKVVLAFIYTCERYFFNLNCAQFVCINIDCLVLRVK